MLCTYCYSTNIIWDYERGYVVCGDCGTVLDVIYYYSINTSQEDGKQIRKLKSIHHIQSMSKYTSTYLRLTKVASRHGLIVDNEVFMRYISGSTPLVKVFKKPNVDISRFMDNEPIKLVLDLMKNYPKLTSRTDRAKVALAKIALDIVMNKNLNVKKLSDELGISEVHIRRLYKTLIREYNFLNDVKKLFLIIEGNTLVNS